MSSSTETNEIARTVRVVQTLRHLTNDGTLYPEDASAVHKAITPQLEIAEQVSLPGHAENVDDALPYPSARDIALTEAKLQEVASNRTLQKDLTERVGTVLRERREKLQEVEEATGITPLLAKVGEVLTERRNQRDTGRLRPGKVDGDALTTINGLAQREAAIHGLFPREVNAPNSDTGLLFDHLVAVGRLKPTSKHRLFGVTQEMINKASLDVLEEHVGYRTLGSAAKDITVFKRPGK